MVRVAKYRGCWYWARFGVQAEYKYDISNISGSPGYACQSLDRSPRRIIAPAV